jgi:hypothetical protein
VSCVDAVMFITCFLIGLALGLIVTVKWIIPWLEKVL